ncbi:31465_t:CDS:1, partial [Gigaspora margarita]
AFDFFGVVREFRYFGIDFALIEKFNDDFKLNPMIRSSVDEFPSSIIDTFNINVPIPVGHHLCISGYASHTKCGDVTIADARASLRPLRPGVQSDSFDHMIRAKIPSSNRDVGGAVFSNEYHNETIFTLVHGILTSTELERYSKAAGSVVIQPLRRIINFPLTRPIFENLRYIDLDTYRQL